MKPWGVRIQTELSVPKYHDAWVTNFTEEVSGGTNKTPLQLTVAFLYLSGQEDTIDYLVLRMSWCTCPDILCGVVPLGVRRRLLLAPVSSHLPWRGGRRTPVSRSVKGFLGCKKSSGHLIKNLLRLNIRRSMT